MKSFDVIFAKMEKRDVKTITKTAFCEWVSAETENLIKPVKMDAFWATCWAYSNFREGLHKKKGPADYGFPSPKGNAVALWAWKSIISRTFFCVHLLLTLKSAQQGAQK